MTNLDNNMKKNKVGKTEWYLRKTCEEEVNGNYTMEIH